MPLIGFIYHLAITNSEPLPSLYHPNGLNTLWLNKNKGTIQSRVRG